jgi:hypothetical protein
MEASLKVHCNIGETYSTLNIPVDKSMKLSNVLEEVGKLRGEYLAMHLYVFEAYNARDRLKTVTYGLIKIDQGHAAVQKFK